MAITRTSGKSLTQRGGCQTIRGQGGLRGGVWFRTRRAGSLGPIPCASDPLRRGPTRQSPRPHRPGALLAWGATVDGMGTQDDVQLLIMLRRRDWGMVEIQAVQEQYPKMDGRDLLRGLQILLADGLIERSSHQRVGHRRHTMQRHRHKPLQPSLAAQVLGRRLPDLGGHRPRGLHRICDQRR
jgi:hypothetical protein